MTDDERVMEHFAATVKPCREKKMAHLEWDGCWCITCGAGCKCQMSDGDNLSPTQLLFRWERRP